MEESNEKRPKFGSRVLDDESRVFEHNAWDNVEWPVEQEEEARRIVAKQLEAPVADDKASAVIARPADYWNDFYETHDKKFFMDRNWLFTEFPELRPQSRQCASNKKQLLRLCCATLKQRPFLEALLEEPDVADLLRDDAISGNTELAWIVLYEFLLGAQGLKASKRVLAAVGQRSEAIHRQRDELVRNGRGPIEEDEASSAPATIPRYARVNTLKTDLNTVLKQLTDDGYEIIDFSSQRVSRRKYRSTVTGLLEHQVMVDSDVPDLLVFPTGTELHKSWMVDEGHLILQDKASCLPAVCLQPEPGSHVFDICAAPGMKTSHLAAVLGNNGKIWSIDKTRDRVETMNSLLERSGVTIASVFCGDFLRTDITDKKFKKVRYALVDPPCSGSGITKRMDHITDEAPTDHYRLNSLGNLQAMILKHALKLPNLERLVYSTCSLYERENEAVIDEVLQSSEVTDRFELVKALPIWKHRGRKGFEFARMCLRANPTKDLTNGFFVAVFQRKNTTVTDE